MWKKTISWMHFLDIRLRLIVIFSLLLLLVTFGSAVSSSPLIVVLLLGAVAISFVSVLRPFIALLLVFLAASLPSLLLPIPGHTIRLIEPALLLCVLLVIIRRPRLRIGLSHLLALLFMSIAIISFIHVPEISTNVNGYAADKRLYALLLLTIAFFCGTFLAGYIQGISSFLVAILLSNIPAYLIGLAQALHAPLPMWLAMSSEVAQNAGRLQGPTSGAATFGLYLTNLFAVALACWLLGTRYRHRFIGCILLFITALEIIGSGTRSALIAACTIMVIALIITRRWRLLCGIALCTVIAAVFFLNTLLPLFAHDESSATNRLFLWNEALALISKYPWIGIGLEQFHVYYERLIINQNTTLNQHGISIHNQYLELALESGIGWLVSAILLLLSIIGTCWMAYLVVPREQRVLLLAALLALLANIITGFFDVPLDKVEGAVSLFMLCGLAVGCVRTPIQAHSRLYDASDGLHSGDIPGTPLLPLSGPNRAGASSVPNEQKTRWAIFLQLLSWAVAIPIIFPTTALLTRYLGPLQYGEYSFVYPFIAVFALLSGTGMDPLIIRQLSRLPRNAWSTTLSYAAGSRLLSTIVSIVLAAIIALLLPVSTQQRQLLLLAAFSLLFSFSFHGLRAIYAHGFRAEQYIGPLILIETINRIVTSMLVLFIVLLHLSLFWSCALILYSDLPFFLILFMLARKRYGIRIRFAWTRIREHLLGSLTLTGSDALTLIAGQVDVFVLMLYSGPFNAGIYALAMRLVDPLISIAFAYVNGLYPLLCASFGRSHTQFAQVYYKATRILSLAIFPLTIFVSVEAETLVALIGGKHFAAATLVVRLLIWAMTITFFNQLTTRACMAANMERRIASVTLASTGMNMLLNFVCIPLWQATGAGIAALGSECFMLCLLMLLLRRSIRILPALNSIARVALSCSPALLLLYWRQPVFAAPCVFLVALVGCMLTRTLTLHDLSMIRDMLLPRIWKGSAQPISQPTDSIIHSRGEITDTPTLILPRVHV